mmetsp:Transcript_3011/g.6482  ORF Transcript_3011/g.6482 Transcript_3011/m.6482 type:complete len:90 (-) Transcript_3011:587-856(-)
MREAFGAMFCAETKSVTVLTDRNIADGLCLVGVQSRKRRASDSSEKHTQQAARAQSIHNHTSPTHIATLSERPLDQPFTALCAEAFPRD